MGHDLNAMISHPDWHKFLSDPDRPAWTRIDIDADLMEQVSSELRARFAALESFHLYPYEAMRVYLGEGMNPADAAAAADCLGWRLVYWMSLDYFLSEGENPVERIKRIGGGPRDRFFSERRYWREGWY